VLSGSTPPTVARVTSRVVGVPLFARADQLVGGLAVFWERAEEA
jgi:hypothetical protein